MLGLVLDPVDRGDMLLLQKVGLSSNYTALQLGVRSHCHKDLKSNFLFVIAVLLFKLGQFFKNVLE
jgi:hypothetical protein